MATNRKRPSLAEDYPDRELGHYRRLRENLKSGEGLRDGFLFLLVGAGNTLIAYGIFASIHVLFNLPYLVTLGMTYLLASMVSFFSQKYVVFRVKKRIFVDFFRFQISGAIVLAINALLLVLLVELATLGVLLSQALATLISVSASYVLHKLFSFRRPNRTEVAGN